MLMTIKPQLKTLAPAALLIQLSRCNPRLCTSLELSNFENRARACFYWPARISR